MKPFKLSLCLVATILISGCFGNLNPIGPPPIDYPYFITTESVTVKKIRVPIGTKLVYEEHFFKQGQQENIMSENKLQTIVFPEKNTIEWGGVPLTSINKFYNSQMKGYSVYPNFEQLSDENRTKFTDLWKSCNSELGISVKNRDDWSFNKKNITDIESCSVLYQRYFEIDSVQQQFLNNLYAALQKIKVN